MVKITNGVMTVDVTQGAFDSYYAKQGFKVVTDKATNDDNLEWEENDNAEE